MDPYKDVWIRSFNFLVDWIKSFMFRCNFDKENGLFEKCLLSIWYLTNAVIVLSYCICCMLYWSISNLEKKPIQYLDVPLYLYYSLSSSHKQPSSSSPWSVSTRCTSQVPVEITSLFLVTLWLHFPFPEKRSHLQTSIETQTSWRPCPDLQGSSPLSALDLSDKWKDPPRSPSESIKWDAFHI